MHKLRNYVLCIITTILLFFVLMAGQAVVFTKVSVLEIDTYTDVIEKNNVTDKVYSQIESNYKSEANATGIPANVYTDAFTKENARNIILNRVQNAFSYINGKSDSLEYSSGELDNLKGSVTGFLSDYADSINHPKDDAYNAKVKSVYSDAESYILDSADVYQFSKIEKAGYLSKMRKAVKYIDTALIATAGAGVVLLLVLIAANRKNIKNCMYWLSISIGSSSILYLGVCAYIKATDYFNSFAIKAPPIFSAMTGLFNKFTDQFIMVNSILLGLSIILTIAYIFGGKDKNYNIQKKESSE